MPHETEIESSGNQLSRRSALGVVAAASCGALACNLDQGLAHADALTRAQRDKLTPDEIISLMIKGNERFRAGAGATRNFLAEQRAAAAGQYPAAVVLSCIDSRAPAEVIMDLGIGDVFNARVAGSIANEDILGSLEFACQVAGAKVIVVLGHTACGAVMGAIDNVELGNLTGLLARIRPAVTATAYDGDRTGKNIEFVNSVARTSVSLTMKAIREKSAVLRDLESQHGVKITGAMYDLETAKVEFLP